MDHPVVLYPKGYFVMNDKNQNGESIDLWDKISLSNECVYDLEQYEKDLFYNLTREDIAEVDFKLLGLPDFHSLDFEDYVKEVFPSIQEESPKRRFLFKESFEVWLNSGKYERESFPVVFNQHLVRSFDLTRCEDHGTFQN